MTERRLARTLLLAVLAALALVSAGCGNKHDIVTEGETEGIWLDVGPLDYQVQGSRILSPGLPSDDAYLMGLPDGISPPGGDELWFGVFVRIENKTGEPAPTAREFEIVDTEGRSFAPIGIDPSSNPFAYQPTTLDPERVIPVSDSAQATSSFQGALLVFKLTLQSYQNRPLQFIIHSAGGDGPEEGELNLDI